MKTRTVTKIIALLIIASLAILFLTHTLTLSSPTAPAEPSLASLQTSPHPWSTESDTLKNRLAAIGLPPLATEGTVLHTHEHLDIFIAGQPLTIPTNIGINTTANFLAPIHTHDDTGIIHVESPTVQTFTLGQFFNIWGVRFTDNCLGSYCNQGDQKLSVYVNSQSIANNYQNISLEAHEEIVITYGTSSQLPQPIPSSYSFPPNY